MTVHSDTGKWRSLIEEAGLGAAGGPSLRHSAGPWTSAAGAAEALRTDLGRVRADFAAAHDGLTAGTAGLGVAAVLGVVRGSWERRVERAMGECGGLSASLRAVARDQGETETAIRSSFARLTPGDGR